MTLALDSGWPAETMQAYERSYDECCELYDKDKYGLCIRKIQSELEDSDIPRYFEIKLLTTLACCYDQLDEMREAKGAIAEAETLRGFVEQYYRHNTGYQHAEKALAELRDFVNDARTAIYEQEEIQTIGDSGAEMICGQDIDTETGEERTVQAANGGALTIQQTTAADDVCDRDLNRRATQKRVPTGDLETSALARLYARRSADAALPPALQQGPTRAKNIPIEKKGKGDATESLPPASRRSTSADNKKEKPTAKKTFAKKTVAKKTVAKKTVAKKTMAKKSAPPKKQPAHETKHRCPEAETAYYSLKASQWTDNANSNWRRELSHVGRIEETVFGKRAPKACSRCRRRSWECKVYTEEGIDAFTTRGGRACAHCRFSGLPCSLKTAVAANPKSETRKEKSRKARQKKVSAAKPALAASQEKGAHLKVATRN